MRGTSRYLLSATVFLSCGLCPIAVAEVFAPLDPPETPVQHQQIPHSQEVVSCPPAVAKLAANRRDYALQLAERGALCSAEEELVEALWLIAQSHDNTGRSSGHRLHLEAALLAIKEAEDFTPFLGRRAIRSGLERACVAHRTTIDRNDLAAVSVVELLRRYLDAAETSFVSALREEKLGAEIVYVMARVEELAARQSDQSTRWSAAKKIMLYRVARRIDPGNVSAANELAVLLGRFGRWEEARDILLSATTDNTPKPAWHNLATIYNALGEHQLAQQATRLSQESVTPPPAVRWVTPAAFTKQVDTDVTIRSPVATKTAPHAAEALGSANEAGGVATTPGSTIRPKNTPPNVEQPGGHFSWARKLFPGKRKQ